MASFSIKLPDLGPLQRSLKGLPARLAKKVLRQAIRKGAKVIQQKANSLAPVDSGMTRKAIKVRAGKRSRKPRIWINTVVGEGDYKGDTFYAAFLEYGHLSGKRGSDGRKAVPARPFMRPAAEQSEAEVTRLVRAEIAAGVEREAAAMKAAK